MSATKTTNLVERIQSAGITLGAETRHTLTAEPAESITPELRELIRQNKEALLDQVLASKEEAFNLLDFFGCKASTKKEVLYYQHRVSHFKSMGMESAPAKELADLLTVRDREYDDRVTCMECRFYSPYMKGGSCRNPLAAQLCLSRNATTIPKELVTQLQRCHGFLQS